jgi:23S rRNA pseudouridine1911/1915/1917 synthase
MKLSDSDILYLDNHIVIVDKPPLLLTLPTELEEESVETLAKEWLKNKLQKKGGVFLHPVHRLDRVAFGIVVLAKTSKSLSRLNEQIRLGNWKKTYKLRYEGTLPEKKGQLRHYLLKEEYKSKVVNEGEGSLAFLNYEEIEPGVCMVELLTGRYHQIRAQFAAIGCPILGDLKYGSTKIGKTLGIDLCHYELKFPHPVTKQEITVRSKICPF